MDIPARDMALAKVAVVAARIDSTRAGKIAFTVTAGAGMTRQVLAGTCPRGPSERMPWERSPMKDQEVQPFLADLAIIILLARLLGMGAKRLACTIAGQGTLRDAAPVSAAAAATQTDLAQAGQLLTEAEQRARAISKSDLRGMTLTSVKAAAAEIDPDHSGQLLL